MDWLQRVGIRVLLDVQKALQNALTHDLDLLDVLLDLTHVINNLGDSLKDLY